jgi:hypothetical protein
VFDPFLKAVSTPNFRMPPIECAEAAQMHRSFPEQSTLPHAFLLPLMSAFLRALSRPPSFSPPLRLLSTAASTADASCWSREGVIQGLKLAHDGPRGKMLPPLAQVEGGVAHAVSRGLGFKFAILLQLGAGAAADGRARISSRLVAAGNLRRVACVLRNNAFAGFAVIHQHHRKQGLPYPVQVAFRAGQSPSVTPYLPLPSPLLALMLPRLHIEQHTLCNVSAGADAQECVRFCHRRQHDALLQVRRHDADPACCVPPPQCVSAQLRAFGIRWRRSAVPGCRAARPHGVSSR